MTEHGDEGGAGQPAESEARCCCGSLTLATTASERHDRGLHGANVCFTSVSITSPVQDVEFETALARLREAHAPTAYEFETDQTYCPASDGPSDQCDVCIVLIGSGLPPTPCLTPPAPTQGQHVEGEGK